MSSILLTFDVEDWFQVENLRPYCPPSTWDEYELRVERSTHLLLDLLDSVSLDARGSEGVAAFSPQASLASPQAPDSSQGTPHTKPTATFFILGWVAERLPGLVREIGNRGHEVASHGYGHKLCSQLGRQELRDDLSRSRKLLEDIAGIRVHGYRAPGFSAEDSVLELVRETGYTYDSSFNAIDFNPRCGHVDLSRAVRRDNAWEMPSGLVELPVSNLRFGSRSIPWGGGGYFRLYPLPLYTAGVKWILRREGGFTFYMHPWEMDPDQPRIAGPGPLARFRHYHNLDKAGAKLEGLLRSLRDRSITSCRDYLKNQPAFGCEGIPSRGRAGCSEVGTGPEAAG